MPRAVCLIRETDHYRKRNFCAGLFANGFQIVPGIDQPQRGDVLIIWNRYSYFAAEADKFEKAGATVLIAENGYMGHKWLDDEWFALSKWQHNGAGDWNVGGPERWDSFGFALSPWREGGTEIVILPQRGFGPKHVAMPNDWTQKTQAKFPQARVRPHPGIKPCLPLEQDLANAKCVMTWGSGAAIKALAMGIPVFYDFPYWIGAPGALPILGCDTDKPLRNDVARLHAMRRISWAMWRASEIGSGEAFRTVLN